MMGREQAETFSLQVLGWVAGQDDLLPVFLGSTGISEADLRTRVGDADVLGAVLDFVLMDDAWVMAVSEAIGVAPETVVQARAALPGGEQVHWT